MKKPISRLKEYLDALAQPPMPWDSRREREKKEQSAMSEAERSAFRGSLMALESFWNCLGPPAEQFAGKDYLERVHDALWDCIIDAESDNGPGPLLFANCGGDVCHERLVKKKYFTSTSRMRLPIAWIAEDATVTLSDLERNPRSSLMRVAAATHFKVWLGVGLFSDMVFSAESGAYVNLHPEWAGKYFSCISPALSLDEPANIDLRVKLPFQDGIPKGLHLVGSISIAFYLMINGKPDQCGGGGMTVSWIGQ